ncbi:hypothetical protein [Comamonas sp. MYb69]|uniref:hypothetical protein n=1 Tax=Comamonas sp. MYb69 TaxID=1848650 RepID=UPI0030B1A3EA
MSAEPYYESNFEADSPEKQYRQYIDKWLVDKTENIRAHKLKARQRKFAKAAPNQKRESSVELIPVLQKPKKRFFVRANKFRQAIDDAVDNFLAICERFGLKAGSIAPTSLENACLAKDSRFLPAELVSLIIRHEEVKEALGDLSLVIAVNQEALIEGRKIPANPNEIARHSSRVRRFFRAGANSYIEKLKQLEDGVDALKDMTGEELNQIEGDLRKIADAVTGVAERIAKEIRRRDAQAGASGKLAKDPKQLAKQQVRECWDIWRGEPSRYKSKSAFAKDMLSKYEQLESSEVIQRWCREWDSELSKQS